MACADGAFGRLNPSEDKKKILSEQSIILRQVNLCLSFCFAILDPGGGSPNATLIVIRRRFLLLVVLEISH